MQTTNKHTCNLQVDILNRLFGQQCETLLGHRLLSCSLHQCCGIHAPQVVRGVRSPARNHVTWRNYMQRGQALEGRGSLGGQALITNARQRELLMQMPSHISRWCICCYKIKTEALHNQDI